MINISLGYKNQLHPGQQQIWNALLIHEDGNYKYKRVVANTGRQVGKTTLAKRYALNKAIKVDGCHIGWLTPENKHFIKVFEWFKGLGVDVIKRYDGIKNIIYFHNGSTISFYSVDNYEAIRGQSFDFRIMDEYAFGRFGQQEAISAYDATMIAKGKQELILSTPNGRNQHYDAYNRALQRDDEFAYAMKTEDNPMVDKQWLAQKKIDLPQRIYQQEYEGIFIESGGEVFTGIDEVATVSSWTNQEANQHYVCGIDWGAKNDKSVLTIINRDTFTVVNIFTSYSDDYTVIGKQFASELLNYNIDTGYAETNGVGQSQFDHFKLEVPMIQPFNTSQKSKDDTVTYLRSLIQNKQIHLPTRELCPELYVELSDYEARVSSNGKYSYGHPKGKHDDYVDSLMFAVWALKPQFTPRSRTTKITNHRNPFR